MGREPYRDFDSLRAKYSKALKKSSEVLPQLLSGSTEGRESVGFQLDPLISPIILRGRDPKIWLPRREIREETYCTLVAETKLPVWLALKLADRINRYIEHFSKNALPWDNPFYTKTRIC